MDTHIDVLGLGAVAVDDLHYVAAYPRADTKVRIKRRERQCGGLTGTALVAASRLGARCAYAGVLGEDALSHYVKECFRQEGVETGTIRKRAGARPIHSIIVVDDHRTRTILFDVAGVVGADPDWPAADVIRSARVLLVDHFGIAGMVRAARIARDAGVAVVADFEVNGLPDCLELLPLIDHLIVSLTFARTVTGETTPTAAAAKLWCEGRQAVVLTDGAAGCWHLSASEPRRVCHQPSFSVNVVDTTGCGDVFHGAYAAALVEGRAPVDGILFASAAAALKATQSGGQAGIPSRSVLEDFLQRTAP